MDIDMLYQETQKVIELKHRLQSFMDRYVYPNEDRFYKEAEDLGPWKVFPVVEELKPKAREAGLWNLFLPQSEHGAGLTNLEYAPLCEVMGRSHLAPELFNCSAPDTGNMEVLARYGTREHQERWLKPLLAGEIRSCFAMTEPAVASSDATNIESSIEREGDDYVINGRKWYTTNATDPRCKICIFMGKTDPDNPDRHRQQSMILVPMDTPALRFCGRFRCSGSMAYPTAPRKSFSATCGFPQRTCCSARAAGSKSRRAVSAPAGFITACG